VLLLCVQAVIGNQDADHSARWLAAVQLKNSVNNYWRPRYDSGCVCKKKLQLLGALPQFAYTARR
jgi:hypothetical protein